jgi:hypothetical protein
MWWNVQDVAEANCKLQTVVAIVMLIMTVLLLVCTAVALSVSMQLKKKPQWMSTADVTMDVVRSRFYAATVFTFLLYTFWRLVFSYYVNEKFDGFLKIRALGIPIALYYLMLSVLWMPMFAVMLVANNPYRGNYSKCVSWFGLLLCDLTAGLAFLVDIYPTFQKIQQKASLTAQALTEEQVAEFVDGLGWSLEMSMYFNSFVLLAFPVVLHIAFFRMVCCKRESFFDVFKRQCEERVTHILNPETKTNSMVQKVGLRATVHIACEHRESCSSFDEIANVFSNLLGNVAPRDIFVPLSVVRIVPAEQKRGISVEKDQEPHKDLRVSKTDALILNLRHKSLLKSRSTRQVELDRSHVLRVDLIIRGPCHTVEEKKWYACVEESVCVCVCVCVFILSRLQLRL